MTTLQSPYVRGITEGRATLNLWKKNAMPVTRERIEQEMLALHNFRAKLAPLAYTAGEIYFVDGQLDFFRNQLTLL